jgi:predicted peroxiredoxin
MPSLLVHVTSGQEAPTRAALAFLVARTALGAGSEVSMFLAGDGVTAVRSEVRAALTGVGTGSLGDHWDALAAGGVRIWCSRGSCAARGIAAADLDGTLVQLAPPEKLIELVFSCDRVLNY